MPVPTKKDESKRPAEPQNPPVDPVFKEPDSRGLAEPTRPVKVEVDKIPEEKTNDPVQDDSSRLSSNKRDRPLDPREVIARKFEQKRYGEPAAAVDDVIETPPEEDEPPAPSEPEKVEVKVNGRVLLVDKAKVDAMGGVELYQKQVALSEGFKDLAAQKKQFEQQQAALKETRQPQPQTKPSLPTKDDSKEPSHDLPVSDDQRQQKRAELVRKHREALLDGDDATADKLMLELLGTAQPTMASTPPINPAELEEHVVQRTVALMTEGERKRELTKAGNDFFSDNPELLTDQRLFVAVDAETNLVAKEHPTWSPREVMNEAYNRVQQWRGTSKPTSSTPASKIAEKRALNSPRAGTGRAEPPPAPRQQTDSEYVTQLRKQRGLE